MMTTKELIMTGHVFLDKLRNRETTVDDEYLDVFEGEYIKRFGELGDVSDDFKVGFYVGFNKQMTEIIERMYTEEEIQEAIKDSERVSHNA